jgi:hypothetical protein
MPEWVRAPGLGMIESPWRELMRQVQINRGEPSGGRFLDGCPIRF